MILVVLCLALFSAAASAEDWPFCISGCTANDVELIEVFAEVAGSPAPDGTVEATLWASLHFNRNKTYCVRFAADVYVDGTLAIAGMVSDPVNVYSKGDYPAIYLGTVALAGGSLLSLDNVRVMWSVDHRLDPVSKCQGCQDYGPNSKCTGDQLGTISVPLPLDAVDDAAETNEDTPVTVAVLQNDSLGAAPTRILDASDGRHGAIERNGDGTITYSPAAEFFGTDSFSYTIEDSRGERDSATVTITVLPVNDPPAAYDDDAVTDENEPAVIDVTANDVDGDGGIDRTTVAITRGPARGTVDIDPRTGTVTYRPDPQACGVDRFSYTVRDADGAVSNEADVTIDVRCNAAPVARDDDATTDENNSVGINVVANDTDQDGSVDPTTVTITRGPGAGQASVHPTTGVVTYTPDRGSCGIDSFRYTVKDDDGATSGEATVEIDVLCDDPPLAIDDLYRAIEGETLSITDPGVLANDVTTPDEPLSAVLVRDVLHGDLVLRADGSFTYIHDGGETTSDLFTYFASDGTDDSNVATVHLAIAPTNDPPAADDDRARTDEDEPVTIDVLANDWDPDGDRLAVDRVSRPANGTAVHNGIDVTYTPDPDFHGVDTFTYAVADGNGGTAEATVTVTVAPVNDPPVAEDDSASTNEETPTTIQVLANDSDPDGDALSIASIGRPADGSAVRSGSAIVYTPDPDFFGVDTFTYAVSDGNGGTAVATVTVAVAPVNDPPTARDDDAETDEDTPVAIDVLTNDSDPEGDDLYIASVSRPSHGTVINDGAAIIYAPDRDFFGNDSFTYMVSDGNGGSDAATVTVAVSAVNDPPLAQDDHAATDEDTPVTIAVLANDTDPDGDRLSIESVTQPMHGTVTQDGSDVRYAPDRDYDGTDTFTYAVSDGNGGTAVATVTVVVRPANDPPAAQDDRATTDEESAVRIDVLANDTDPDGDLLSVESVTQPAHGTVLNNGSDVTYTPAPDYFGADAFTYVVRDGNGLSDTATVTVTVKNVNDPPIAQDDSATTDEDVLVTIPVLANDSDPDGDFLVVESVTRPANGSVINAGNTVSYVPDPGFHGVDTFRYAITDNNGGADEATVIVSVASVNDPPVAEDDGATTEEETPVTIDVLANDSDPDGDPLAIQSVARPAHGTVTHDGAFVRYVPAPGFHGIDSFAYTVSDGNGGSDGAMVTVAVSAVNDPPLAQDDSATTGEETPVAIAVLANDSDPDGDRLSIQSVSQPAHGDVIHDGVDATYTPAPGFHGIDGFTYIVSDGNGGTDQASVTVAVAAVNDPPLAQDDSARTNEGTPVSVSVLANDSDPDGDSLTIQSVSQPAHGTAVNDGTRVTYAPALGFHGTDNFTYTVSDGNGGTDTATVTVAVAAVNDPPFAQDDSATTNEDTPIAIDVLGNDGDPEGDRLSVASVTQPAHGTVTHNNAEATYAPDTDFYGIDRFTYTISDGNGGTDEATVTVAVAAVNDPPLARDDSATTQEDVPVTIGVLSNDTDPDGDALSIESLGRPRFGAVTRSGSNIVYTPAPDASGTDAFAYTISDGRGKTATATVTVTVISMNDAPTARDDSSATHENAPVAVLVLANDDDPDGDALSVESVSQPAHGTTVIDGNSVTYTPDRGFTGTDTFSYTASDGNGGKDQGTVTVVVHAVNDAPTAQNDSASTAAGTLVTIPVLANDSDPDGDFLLVVSVGQPRNGSLLNTRTGISYIPNPGFEGIDTFFYIVSDGNGGTATATVTVSVASANEAPIARDDNASSDEGVAVVIPVLLNDQDPDGDPLFIESVTQAEHGTVSSRGSDLTYTPDPGHTGLDTFSYTVSDGRGGTGTATVFVAIAPINDPPTAQDDSETTDQNTPVTIAVLANDSDPDGDRLTVVSVSQPSHGTVVNAGTEVVYTPAPGFSGTDSFDYIVSDAQGLTDTGTVTVGVASVVGRGGATDPSACDGRVIINEVAWAGTVSDPRDEWIELRNVGTTPVRLDGWTLQWRRSHPSAAEEYIYRVVELAGVLQPASVSACEETVDTTTSGRVFRENPDDVEWLVTSRVDEPAGGYFVLERRHDDTISDRKADLVYDTSSLLELELSDQGEVILLVNGLGEIVDTANASNLGRSGWVAGSAATFATMERIDPLGPDIAANWRTNDGIAIHGVDRKGRPLRATAGRANSTSLEELDGYADILLASVRAGQVLEVDVPLSRQDRKTAGWPWINVSRPGATAAGGGAAIVGYSFSGRYGRGDQYLLEIGTKDLPPGSYVFSVVYGQGKAVLVPILVTR